MPQNSRAMFKENPMFAALRVLLMRRYDAKAAVKDDPSKSIRIPIHRLRLYEVRATLVKWSIRFNDSVLKNCCAPYARMETEKRCQENDVEWEKKTNRAQRWRHRNVPIQGNEHCWRVSRKKMV